MDKFEQRRLRLLELVKSIAGGKIVVFAEKIGREQSYVSRMLYPKGKRGKKNIGEDMVAYIEEVLNLPKGWIDCRSDESKDWPFLSFTPDDYFLLSSEDKEEIEILIKLKIDRVKRQQAEKKIT